MKTVSICASYKSESGRAGKRSATRQLGSIARSALARIVGPVDDLNLCDSRLPFFEGVPLTYYDDEGSMSFHKSIADATAILLQAPAYWQGPSGVVKNLLDLLGGAAYDDRNDCKTILQDKKVALMIVGAQSGDAELAKDQLRRTVISLGGQPMDNSFTIDNPAQHDHEMLIRMAWQFGIHTGKELIG